MKYALFKKYKKTVSCMKMSSKRKINKVNELELLRIKAELALKEKLESKKIEVEIIKLNLMKDIEDNKIAVEDNKNAVTQEIEVRKIAVMKEIEDKKIDMMKNAGRLYALLWVISLIFLFTFGVQLRDGLLGRVTTFNSMINELKAGILNLTRTVQIFIGGKLAEAFVNNIASVRSFICKLLWK